MKASAVKAVMTTLGVDYKDIVSNDVLLDIVGNRISDGSLDKDKLSEVVETQNDPETLINDSDAKANDVTILTHEPTGLKYAARNGKVLGLVIEDATAGNFILSLKNSEDSMLMAAALAMAAQQPKVNGMSWVIPGNGQWAALARTGFVKVNKALKALGGDMMNINIVTSSTNVLKTDLPLYVRLVLPLPDNKI